MQQPYDGEKLDRLMQEAGVDLVLANSRENVRYLCGGYYFHFHERFTAIGHGQYMALAGIPRGDAGKSFLIGGGGELGQAQDQNLWIPELIPSGRVPAEAAADAAHAISERGLGSGTIAVEENFLPAAAKEALSRALPNATFVEALPILEELRAIKTPEESELYRRISQADAEAIRDAFETAKPGATTRDVAHAVERGMTDRGLHFLWVFAAAGPGMLRAPSEKVWEKGEVLHLDAGGSQSDYLTDICRMGVRGEPTPLADELYKACLGTQDHVRAEIRPGAVCGDIYEKGQKYLQNTEHGEYGNFIIHGIGMVSHEQPYFGPGVERALEEGMVVSIETDIRHPEVGFVKVEDAVAVTADGYEPLGDLGREDWVVID